MSSGVFDVELSDLGEKQAKEQGERCAKENIDAISCSTLQRSYKSAKIAFAGRNIPIIKDARLNECDYGELTRAPYAKVKKVNTEYISKPFPGGESYEQTADQMKSFLRDLLKNYNGKKVMIIGHRATQYGLEHCINRIPLREGVTAPWQWQPGWTYQLKTL